MDLCLLQRTARAGSRFRVLGSGFRVLGSGFWVPGLKNQTQKQNWLLLIDHC